MNRNRPSAHELDDLWEEIRQRMGVCPSFFRLAAPDPLIARSLFDLAKLAYLESPIPAELKEKLFVYLSRFCPVPYCVARHTAFLLGRGYVAGDPRVAPISGSDVKALLQEPLPTPEESSRLLSELEAQPAPLTEWPAFDSATGRLLRAACTKVFLEPERSTRWCTALRRWVGARAYEQLMLFLAFVRTAHFWTEVHPELELEHDVSILLEEQEVLAKSVFESRAETGLGERQTVELRELREAAALMDALRDSEERFRILAEMVPAMVWTARPDGDVIYVNQRWMDYSGQTPEEYRGSGWSEVVHPDDRPRILAEWERCRQSGEVYEGEVRYRRRDGRYRWHYFRSVPRRGEDGAIHAWYGASLDVQEKKAADEARRESEQRFSRFMQHLPGLAWIKDLQGRYVYVNDGAERAFQKTRAELYGRTDKEVFPPETAAQFRENDRRALASESGIQTVETLKHDDGVTHHSLVNKFPILGPDGNPALVAGMAIDITERMQAEEALRESEERYRAVVESQVEMVCRFRSDGTILFANSAYAQARGVEPPEALRGRNLWEFVAEQDRPAVRAMLDRLTPEAPEVRIENRFTTFHGERWILWTNRGLAFDRDGKLVEAQSAGIDITQRKQMEEALREADRRKDEFLAMLAHELRNPLAPLRNMVEIMKSAEGDPELLRRARRIMERQLGQMVRLIDDLLDVSRISRGKINLRKERCELTVLVKDAVADVRPLCEELGQELTLALPDREIFLHADPTRISQIVGNLLSNACKFTPRGGRAHLAVESQNGQVVLRVQDTGIGVASEQLPNIFEMFSQVETPVEQSQGGLGIGLSLVKRLAEMHAGSVEARSEGVGKGSEFLVRLPIAGNEPSLPAVPPPATEKESSPKRRILVVDDNVDSADSLALLLRVHGHQVEVAYDGIDALAAAATFAPDVVLLDVGMPKLDGYETARLMRAQGCGRSLLLIALTGWGQDEDRRRSREAGFDAHLVKPIDLASLDAILEEMMDRA